MKFLRATIDTGGYIETLPTFGRCARTVHRETRDLHYRTDVLDSLTDAKEAGEAEEIILGLTDAGGVAEIWTRPAYEAELRKRLTVWHSCYGRWPVRLLNG